MMGTTGQTWGSYKSNLENKRTTCAYNETFPTSLSNTTMLRQQILTFWAQEQKKAHQLSFLFSLLKRFGRMTQ